jgi:hypothetical protein
MTLSVDTSALRHSEALNRYNEVTKNIIAAILDGNDNLQAVVEEQTNRIFRQFKAAEESAGQRHGETMSAIRDLSVQFAQSRMPPNPQEVDHAAVRRQILSSLNYELMDDRYEDIKPAHKKTFEWIYTTGMDEKLPWPSFGDWLRQERGIYWISGKAGSGKSTLMKFLYQEDRTREALQAWADGRPLLILSFYFFNLGTNIQKSIRGLYQSLLYQAVLQQSELGPVLFPDRYEPYAKWEYFPTMNQLRQAYRRLITQDIVDLKLVLLIDGLDEFEDAADRMEELADMFLSGVGMPNVKVVLSSRPHPVFNEWFAGCAQVRLHELTHSDITTYVHDKIRQHQRMLALAGENPLGTESFVAEIVDSAAGVFLWVKLVVRSLLEGLRNYDSLEDLRLRLGQLPKDLEALFKHMLSRIPQVCRRQSSQIFQILHCNQSPSHGKKSGHQLPITALDLHFASLKLQDVLESGVAPLDEEQIQARVSASESRLSSQCGGLIELQFQTSLSVDLRAVQSKNPLVRYLHRSVAEFLSETDVWSEILGCTKGTSFDPNTSLLQAMVMRLKHITDSRENWAHNLWPIIRYAMDLAGQAEISTSKAQDALLDDLDKTMCVHFSKTKVYHKPHFTYWCDTVIEDYIRAEPWHDNFIAFTVRHGLVQYATLKFEKHGDRLIEKRGRPILDYACRPEPQYDDWDSAISPDLVKLLLQYGADPNEKFHGFSPWQNALYQPTKDLCKWFNILKLLLENGAEPNAFVEWQHRETKRVWSKRRYSALYMVLKNISEWRSLNQLDKGMEDLANEVVRILREKGGRVTITYEVLNENGTSTFEDQVLSREEAPFLTVEDLNQANAQVSKQQEKQAIDKSLVKKQSRSIRRKIAGFFRN